MLQLPSIPPSQYQPKHYCDHKLKDKEMDLDEFTEFLRHLPYSRIQWVVEWWRITDMANHVFKDNCVSLIRFRATILTTPQAVLQGNLVTAKEFLILMESFTFRSSLRGFWVESMRLGGRGWWLRISVSLGFFILHRVTRLG